MKLTVIVPIYNSEYYIQAFLEALLKNDFFFGDEVILVDNGSTDNSLTICQRMVGKNKYFKIVSYTEKAGSYAARNYAVSISTGDVLVFTDSDTQPCCDWLNQIRKLTKEGNVIAGKIQLDVVDSCNMWEQYDSFAHLNSEVNARHNLIATANMAVYKSDFERVGYFEERFSGGDYAWSQAAAKYGLKIVFAEKVLVHHPTRKSFEEIIKKEQRIAYGAGNHYRLIQKSYFLLRLRYFFKIFKIDTNWRYSKKLKNRHFNFKNIVIFNVKFMNIRVEQFKYCKLGYYGVDARKLKIK